MHGAYFKIESGLEETRLWRMQMDKEKSRLTPLKAIRAKCIDCSAGYLGEVRLCPVTTCPIWPYRMGRRPNLSSDVPQKMRSVNQITKGQRKRNNESTI
jgi:hypothetical protein